MVLLASSHCDIQNTVARFAVGCEADRISLRPRLSAGKLLCWKSSVISGCSSRVRVKWLIGMQSGVMSAVMLVYRTVMMKQEMRWKEKFLIYQFIYAPRWPHLHPSTMGTDRKNEIVNKSNHNRFCLQDGWSYIRKELGGASSPPHQKQPA